MDATTILELALLTPVAAYCIGAIVHIVIDQVHGKKLVTRYFETTKREIIEPLRAQLIGTMNDLANRMDHMEPEISSLKNPDFGSSFDSFLRSENGKQWARELAGVTAQDITDQMVAKTTSLAGNAARTAQQRIFQLIDGQLDFGNPILNGAWQAVDKGTKIRFYNQVARVIRKSGLMLVPANGEAERPLIEGEFEEVGEDGGTVDPATLALYR